ncbi:protein FAR1-RELATED SEQUENCE 5-like [Trifolium pratense]|uniref:protein FAR1-RELATED SEQUENCE 5-like n=1 Tax=Trifolium pratense TaxID=57577 RepID=UPI001E690EFE|nr:protein FAR1-RELATED SEQUENCE 5-like [Trifolium pratense]
MNNQVCGEVVGDADGAVSGEVRGEVVGDADGAVSGEVRGAVDGGVAGVSSARNEVMDAYFQALNELTQENPSYREHCRGDEDNIGDNDIGFDAEDDNVGHSADHDYNDYNDYEEDDESLGGELDGDESYSDTDNEWEHLDESGNTVANDLDENSDTDNEWTHLDENAEQLVIIDGEEDVVKIDMFNLHNEDVSKLRFGNLEVAYKFYCWFAKMNGFAVCKGQDVRNKDGVLVQKTFVCNLEGYRKDRRDLTEVTRKRGPKHETRCGCSARLRVHIDIISGLWYITIFSFEHNHYMLTEKHCGLLAAHRKLTKSDQIQIKNYGQAGIKVAQMIGAFANAAGGYDKVGFLKKDLHNQIQRQRKETSSDAKGVVKYLLGLRTKDPLMFVAHTVDACGRLQSLFWCDGESQKNYEVFGDVLAFDATYNKNKYRCSFVVFSGVNHHNQTIIFATAVVSNEVEGTYVWLLEQFLLAMKGKAPVSVITDGDVAMRNAIRRVCPNSYHRLCAWHLLRNAMSNIGNLEFIPYLKKCMLGDNDVWKFEKLWNEMIDKFGLQDNSWIKELYQKKKMWSTAHIRGHFFAGIRTTSRCEAFHSHMGQFVHSKMNMTDFVKQFNRCVCYFRFKEVEADFHSQYGNAVLQTPLRSLERSASKQFTHEIFCLVRSVLKKVSLISLCDTQEMASFSSYSVTKYQDEGHVCRVSHSPSNNEFKCSCLRMESIGIPCEHIVAIMVYLDTVEFPTNLVLNRWSKFAKDSIRGNVNDGSHYWDSHLVARHANLVHLSKEVSDLAYKDVDDYKNYLDYLTNEITRLKSKYVGDNGPVNLNGPVEVDNILNPSCARSKGGGPSSNNTTTGRSRHP